MKKYFIILNSLFIVAASYIGVSAFYQTTMAKMGSYELKMVPDEKEPPRQKEAFNPLSYYQPIAERNLFDVKGDTPAVSENVDLESLKQTELNLKLWGTVTGDPKKAYAVIQDTKANTQNLYHSGETIQGALIKMILRGKVVLRVGDKDEILEMEKTGDVPTMQANIQDEGMEEQMGHGKKMMEQQAQTIALDRSQIDTALKNVNELMQQVKIMPHFEGGTPDGFSLTGIKPNSLIRKMGLRNGDIITGVNGKKIETMDDAMSFYQQLNSSQNLSVQVKRRGRERTIDYNIK